jgi:coenzyme F420-0:L-glutamate ligase/coenzyme F420-1:gamma-L-glutamate ligase
MSLKAGFSVYPLPGVPEIQPGDDLALAIHGAAKEAGCSLSDGILAVCQKVVSKAEGRIIALSQVEPSEEALRLAIEMEKDPRHVEVVLRESKRIVRQGERVLICESHQGFVCANAGVDLSNAPLSSNSDTPEEGQEEVAVLLPEDCDASAQKLRDSLQELGCTPLGVIVTDTFGRPWREALVDVALGSAGFPSVQDQRGETDRSGRELQVTTMATVDQLAAAAGVLMEKSSGIPAVWISGPAISEKLKAPSNDEASGVSGLLRDSENDLFR